MSLVASNASPWRPPPIGEWTADTYRQAYAAGMPVAIAGDYDKMVTWIAERNMSLVNTNDALGGYGGYSGGGSWAQLDALVGRYGFEPLPWSMIDSLTPAGVTRQQVVARYRTTPGLGAVSPTSYTSSFGFLPPGVGFAPPSTTPTFPAPGPTAPSSASVGGAAAGALGGLAMDWLRRQIMGGGAAPTVPALGPGPTGPTGGPAPTATFFGGECPPGRVLRRRPWSRDICIKKPRMNPFNPRALARADRRVTSFARRSKAILQDLGFHVAPRKKTSLGKRRRR